MQGLLVLDVDARPHGLGFPPESGRRGFPGGLGESGSEHLGDEFAERLALFPLEAPERLENGGIDVDRRACHDARC